MRWAWVPLNPAGPRHRAGRRSVWRGPETNEGSRYCGCLQTFIKRRDRDSNPGYPCGYSGFQDRCDRPLCHLSGADARKKFAECQRLYTASTQKIGDWFCDARRIRRRDELAVESILGMRGLRTGPLRSRSLRRLVPNELQAVLCKSEVTSLPHRLALLLAGHLAGNPDRRNISEDAAESDSRRHNQSAVPSETS